MLLSGILQWLGRGQSGHADFCIYSFHLAQWSLAIVILRKGNLERKYLYPGTENTKYAMSLKNLT